MNIFVLLYDYDHYEFFVMMIEISKYKKGYVYIMANGKSLGPSNGMNTRPAKSLNQRPASPVMTSGYQNTRQVNSTQPRPTSNPTVQQMKPVPNTVGVIQQPTPKFVGNNQTQVTSQSTYKPQIQQNNSGEANAMSEFVNVLKNMVGGFAILSDDVINQNLQLAAGRGMTTDDRTISFECADYLMSNLAFIFMGLVLDNNFKNAFMDSLMVELQIDNQPDDIKKKTRESMKDKKEYKSNGSIVIGVTTFMPNVAKELMNKMNKGFELLEPFADEFDTEVAKLTPDQKVEYGFIFSNFMYLIRAFTHNDMFMSYVITVIEKVKSITVVKK